MPRAVSCAARLPHDYHGQRLPPGTMRHDPDLALACRAGQLTVADGMSVVWALRASGQQAPERVAGVDLMARLLAVAGEHRLRVYFLGARREVVTALVERTRAEYPGLEIAGFRDGYFGPTIT